MPDNHSEWKNIANSKAKAWKTFCGWGLLIKEEGMGDTEREEEKHRRKMSKGQCEKEKKRRDR